MIIETTTRRAMLKAALNGVDKGQRGSIISRVADSASAGIGEKKIPDWNAHLSHRTYQTLQRQGVMA